MRGEEAGPSFLLGEGVAWRVYGKPQLRELTRAISLDAHLPVAAGIGVLGLDSGHTLSHRAVLGHADSRVGGDVKPGAVVILVQHSDVDLGVNVTRDLSPPPSLSPKHQGPTVGPWGPDLHSVWPISSLSEPA